MEILVSDTLRPTQKRLLGELHLPDVLGYITSFALLLLASPLPVVDLSKQSFC